MSATDVLRRAAAHVVVDDVGAPALGDDAQHHLFRVLRLRSGETVTVTDGAGAWRACEVAGGGLEPVGEVMFEQRRPAPVTIAFVVPKQDRPEWIVQKLTELGADRIVVMESERSVVRWADERAIKHIERLRRVALEALHQCRAVWLPTIEGPCPAVDVLPHACAAEPGGRGLDAADRVIAIGPEGGWTPSELERAGDRVSLGDRILRVETAAITACVRVLAFDPAV